MMLPKTTADTMSWAIPTAVGTEREETQWNR
jgi:hypothetical protein